MAAVSADGEHYRFTSLVGWLKLQLKGTKTVSSILINELAGNPLCAYINVAFPTSGTEITTTYGDTMDEDGIANLTVTLSSPVTLNESTATDFYIALPPMSRTLSSGLRINFTDGTYEDLSTGNTVTIEANKVTPMAQKEVGVIPATLVAGQTFNAALKTLAAGSDKLYTDTDDLIKGIELSINDATTSSVNVSNTPAYPIYATIDGGTGIVTLHTLANRISLPSDCSYMFSNMNELTALALLSEVQTTAVSSVTSMFASCAKLLSINLSSLATADIVIFNDMFNGCAALSTLDVTGFNTAKATQMQRMFKNCTNLTAIDVSGFNTAKCYQFTQMFYGCNNLTTIGGNFINHPSALSFAVSMGEMFTLCTKLKSISLGTVQGASQEVYCQYLCGGCTELESFRATGLGKIYNANYAFSNCQSIESIDLGSSSDWTNASANFKYMFNSCYKLADLNIGHFSMNMTPELGIYDNMFINAGRDVTMIVDVANPESLIFTDSSYRERIGLKTTDITLK